MNLFKRFSIYILLAVILSTGGCNSYQTRVDELFKVFDLTQHPEAYAGGEGAPPFSGIIGQILKSVTPPNLSARYAFLWDWAEPLSFNVELPRESLLSFYWGFRSGSGDPEGNYRFSVHIKQGDKDKVIFESNGDVPTVANEPDCRYEKVLVEGFKPGMSTVTFILEDPDNLRLSDLFILASPKFSPARNAEPKRVIFVGVDTLRADHLSCYGYNLPTTPNIDEWANNSATRYSYCVSTSPWTLSSFSSIMTSRYPSICGATYSTRGLSDDETTLAEVFNQNGFSTFAIINNSQISYPANFIQGFESSVLLKQARCADSFKAAEDWIGKHKDEDIFIFIHLMDPHSPYQPPEEYGRIYFPDYIEPSPDGVIDSTPPLPRQVRNRGPQGEIDTGLNTGDPPGRARGGATPAIENRYFDPEQTNENRALYDGEITYVDYEYGLFLSYLKDIKVFEDSIIVFTGDHGEEFNDHGLSGHGHTLYDELIHVPLLIQGDGFNGGQVIDNLVSTIDIFPTLLAAYGITIPEGINGKSLSDPVDVERLVISEELLYDVEEKGITSKEYRYILSPVTQFEELYDLKDDPAMLSSVAEDRRSTGRGFNELITEHIKAYSSTWEITFYPNSVSSSQITYSGKVICPAGFVAITPGSFDSDDSVANTLNSLIFSVTPVKGSPKTITFYAVRDRIPLEFDLSANKSPLTPDMIFLGPGINHPESSNFSFMSTEGFFTAEAAEGEQTGGVHIMASSKSNKEIPEPHFTPEMEKELRSLGYLN